MRISDWSSDVCSSDLPKGVFMIKSNREAHGASTSFLALGCVGFIASAIAFPAAAQDAASADEGNATRLKGVVVTDTALEEGPKVDRVKSPKATAAILDTPQTTTAISTQPTPPTTKTP